MYDKLLVLKLNDEQVVVKKKVQEIADYFDIEEDVDLTKLKESVETIQKESFVKENPTEASSEKNEQLIAAPVMESKTKEEQIPEKTVEEPLKATEELTKEETATIKTELPKQEIEEEEPIVEPTNIKDSSPEEINNNGKKEIVSDKFQNTVHYRNEKFTTGINKEDVTKKITSKPIDDISKAIGINDKFLLTKELFRGNSKLYKDTIDYLNNAPDFDDAILYITNNFDWNPEDENVQKLIELVKRRHAVV